MKKGNIIVTVAAFFAIFFIFCGFSIDFASMIMARSQLQSAVENAALAGVVEANEAKMKTTARNIFSYSRINGAKYAKIDNIETKPETTKNLAKIRIKVSTASPTYFLSALGIRYINIKAQAAAEATKPTATAKKINKHNIQFDLSNIIISKNSDDIKIETANWNKEIASAKSKTGYKVFASLIDPVTNKHISWVEITCSRNKQNDNISSYMVNAKCVKSNYNGGVAAAQAFRVINNNSEYLMSIYEFEVLTKVAKLIPSSKY